MSCSPALGLTLQAAHQLNQLSAKYMQMERNEKAKAVAGKKRTIEDDSSEDSSEDPSDDEDDEGGDEDDVDDDE